MFPSETCLSLQQSKPRVLAVDSFQGADWRFCCTSLLNCTVFYNPGESALSDISNQSYQILNTHSYEGYLVVEHCSSTPLPPAVATAPELEGCGTGTRHHTPSPSSQLPDLSVSIWSPKQCEEAPGESRALQDAWKSSASIRVCRGAARRIPT